MQEEFKSDALFLWWCLPSILKPRPNDSNISTQHIPTMLAQHLKAPAKRLQHLNATDRNMLHAFCHHIAACCRSQVRARMSRMPGRNIVARTWPNDYSIMQHLQKIWSFSNLNQQHGPNMSQHVATEWPNARNVLHPTMLRSFGRGLIIV